MRRHDADKYASDHKENRKSESKRANAASDNPPRGSSSKCLNDRDDAEHDETN